MNIDDGTRVPRPPQVAIGICVLVLVSTSLLSWRAQRETLPEWLGPSWRLTNQGIRESVAATGPLVAFLAALVGRRRHTVGVGRTSGRPFSQIARAELTPFVLAAWCGVAIGSAPSLLASAQDSSSGSLQVLGFIAALAALTAFSVSGFAAGAVFRSRLVPTGAAAAGLLVVVAPSVLSNGRRSFLSAAPAWLDFRVEPGWVEVPAIQFARAVLFSSIAAAAFAVCTSIQGSRTMAGRFGRVGVAFLAPFVLVVGLLIKQPQIVRVEPAVACTSVSGFELCRPAELAGQLTPITRGFSLTADQVGLGAIFESGPLEISPPLLGTTSETESVSSILAARQIAGSSACEHVALARDDVALLNPGGSLYSSYVSALDLARRISGAAGVQDDLLASYFSPPTSDFAARDGWTTSDLRKYITSHADELAKCEPTPVA